MNTINLPRLAAVHALIEADDGTLCHMSTTGYGCGTPACLIGWMRQAQAAEAVDNGEDPDDDTTLLYEWIGMEKNNLSRLMVMDGPWGVHLNTNMGLFDENPPAIRRAVMLEILTQLRETGTWDWKSALRLHKAKGLQSPSFSFSDL